jgi:hypothetical protein
MTRHANPDKSWSKLTGETRRETWSGPNDKADTFYNDRVGSEDIDDLDLKHVPGVGTVSFTVTDDQEGQSGGTNEEDNAIWEILPQDVFKDLRAHPYFNPSDSIVSEIVTADNAIKKGTAFSTSGMTWATQVGKYYALRMRGVQGYLENNIVINKTITTSSRSIIEAVYDDVGRAVKLPRINPPEQLLGNLAAIIKIPDNSNYLPVVDNNANTPYWVTDASIPYTATAWEWLAKRPTIRSLADGKRFEIQYSWWGAERWSMVLYGGTWDPSFS